MKKKVFTSKNTESHIIQYILRINITVTVNIPIYITFESTKINYSLQMYDDFITPARKIHKLDT